MRESNVPSAELREMPRVDIYICSQAVKYYFSISVFVDFLDPALQSPLQLHFVFALQLPFPPPLLNRIEGLVDEHGHALSDRRSIPGEPPARVW
eukprot:gene974-biopygen13328